MPVRDTDAPTRRGTTTDRRAWRVSVSAVRGDAKHPSGMRRASARLPQPCLAWVAVLLLCWLHVCSTGRWACSQRCETSVSEGQGLRILHGHRQLRMVSRFRTLPGPIHQPNWLLEIERQGIYTVVRTLIFLGH